MSKAVFGLRFLAATIAVLVVSFLLPLMPVPGRLEAIFKGLSTARLPAPVSTQILLLEISAQNSLESTGPSAWAEYFLALLEMGADRVLVTEEVESKYAVTSISEENRQQLVTKFDEEFSLIETNISAFFEAILLGSIPPAKSSQFVDELTALVGKSKALLLSAVLGEKQEQLYVLGQSMQIFGPDGFGTNLAGFGIEPPVYQNAKAILLYPRAEDGVLPFRRLLLTEIIRYIDAAKRLRAELLHMEHSGYLSTLDPRYHPIILSDHATSKRRELLANPNQEMGEAWRVAVKSYYDAVEALLAGKTEELLVEGLDELAESETLEEAGAVKVDEMKQTVGNSFRAAGETYEELVILRKTLMDTMRDAFVIIGSAPNPARRLEDIWDNPTPAEEMAALANSILTGYHVTAPTGRNLSIWILAIGITIALILSALRPFIAIVAAIASLLAAMGATTLLFLKADLWIDPFFSSIAIWSSAALSILVGSIARIRIVRLINGRAHDRLPRKTLRSIIAHGRLPKDAVGVSPATVVAVCPKSAPEKSTKDVVLREIAGNIRAHGGIILGYEGLTVLAGFGTPLDGAVRRSKHAEQAESPARRACLAVLDLMASSSTDGNELHFGLDSSDLSFACSPIGGYNASGRAVGYAKRLCGLTEKYSCSVLVSQGIVSEAGKDFEVKRRGRLVSTPGDQEHPFYELNGRKAP